MKFSIFCRFFFAVNKFKVIPGNLQRHDSTRCSVTQFKTLPADSSVIAGGGGYLPVHDVSGRATFLGVEFCAGSKFE